MADAPDWSQSAIIASGALQVVGGGQADRFVDQVAAAAWASHVPTAGRKVIAWTVTNTGAVNIEVGLGSAAKAQTLEPGQSWSPPFNGTIHVRRAANATANGTYDATAVEA